MDAEKMTKEQLVQMPVRAVLALALLGAGSVLLVVMAIVVHDKAWGLPLSLVGLILLVAAVTRYPASSVFLPYCNFLAALVLVFQMVGLCSSQCGAFADYDTIAGFLSVAVAGLAYHVGMTALGTYARVKDRFWWPYLIASFAGQGASMFFAVILISHDMWCSSCMAAHMCMAAQLVQNVRLAHNKPYVKSMVFLGPVTAALAWNAVFHHQIPSREVKNDYLVMADWLRDQQGQRRIAIGEVRQQQSDSESIETVRASTDEVDSDVSMLAHGQQSREQFISWGKQDAPLQVKVMLSPTCPACLRHWPEILKNRKLVESGLVRLDFLWTYSLTPKPDLAAKVATYYVYTMGFLGAEEMLQASAYIFSPEGQQRLEYINELQRDLNKVEQQVAQSQVVLKDLDKHIEASEGEERQLLEEQRRQLSEQLPQLKQKVQRAKDEGMREAFLALFNTLPGNVTMAQALRIYEKENESIWDQIKRNFRFIIEEGKQGTPRYFLVDQADIDGRVWQEVQNLNPDVLLYAILRKRSLNLGDIGIAKGIDIQTLTVAELATITDNLTRKETP